MTQHCNAVTVDGPLAHARTSINAPSARTATAFLPPECSEIAAAAA